MKGYGQSPAHQPAVTPHVSLTSIREYLNVVSKWSLVTLNMISANHSCRSLLLSVFGLSTLHLSFQSISPFFPVLLCALGGFPFNLFHLYCFVLWPMEMMSGSGGAGRKRDQCICSHLFACWPRQQAPLPKATQLLVWSPPPCQPPEL